MVGEFREVVTSKCLAIISTQEVLANFCCYHPPRASPEEQRRVRVDEVLALTELTVFPGKIDTDHLSARMRSLRWESACDRRFRLLSAGLEAACLRKGRISCFLRNE